MKYANLHLHSNHSDGGFRPAFLTRTAKSLGYGAIALTDHETLTGLPELFEAAKNDGIEAMAGVEFCTHYKGHEIHITGLDFDHTHPSIINFSKCVCERINHRIRVQFEDMMERGDFSGITWEEITRYAPRTDFYCIDHICHVFDLLGICSYTDFARVRESLHACDPSKYEFHRPSVQETIQTIRNAGGVAVIAHPSEAIFDEGIVDELIGMGINGIEVSHPEVTQKGAKLAIYTAMQHNLYISGGTDHTGALSACDGDNARMAFHGVTLEEYNTIKERHFG